MLEQVKQILTEKYNAKIEEFTNIKNQIDEIEKQMINDNSDELYKEHLDQIKSSGIKRGSKEYEEQVAALDKKYDDDLLDFKEQYDKYQELRKTLSSIDYYRYTRNITRLENANELSDLGLDEEKAQKIISGELEDI